MLKILAILAGVLGVIGGLGFVPFVDANIGILIAGVCSALVGVVLKIGDYMDDKVLNDSFKAEDVSFLSKLLNMFKK